MEKSLSILCLTFCLLAQPSAFAQTSDVYTLKAALNYNFAKYTQWPTDSDEKHVEICYFNEAFRSSFEPLVGRPIAGKTITIRKLGSGHEVARCDLLFVDADNSDLFTQSMARLKAAPILTVADFSGFADQGGMIEILTVGNKLRFKVNLARLQESGISLSSQVLSLAAEVTQ